MVKCINATMQFYHLSDVQIITVEFSTAATYNHLPHTKSSHIPRRGFTKFTQLHVVTYQIYQIYSYEQQTHKGIWHTYTKLHRKGSHSYPLIKVTPQPCRSLWDNSARLTPNSLEVLTEVQESIVETQLNCIGVISEDNHLTSSASTQQVSLDRCWIPLVIHLILAQNREPTVG